MAEEPEFTSGCAFPPGVVHDHGYRGCHEKTAQAAAVMAVQSFLTGIAGGEHVAQCENTQCRVALYTVPSDHGRMIPVCPGCYGSPSQ